MAQSINPPIIPLNSSLTSLFRLPNELLTLIANVSTPGALANLMLTNKHLFLICAPVIQEKAMETSYYTTVALFWAAAIGNKKFLLKLLANTDSVEVIDATGPRQFSRADLRPGMFKVVPQKPVEDLVEFVLKKGIKLLLRKTHRSAYTSSISWAAENSHMGLLKLAFEKGTKVDQRNHLGQPPLHIALLNGNESMAKCLLTEFSAKVNTVDQNSKTPLILALQHCHKIVELLLELGANPQYRIDTQPQRGWRPLHFAASVCNEEAVKLLLDYGASPDTGMGSDTPLHVAAAEKNGGDIVKLLLKAGPSPISRCSGWTTPFELAEASGNSAVGELLCALWDSGASKPLSDGRTFTHLAARYSQMGLLTQLLDMKCDIEEKDALGRRPLHSAAASSSNVAAIALVAAGAELDCIDHAGQAPLHIAATVSGLEVYSTLLELGSRCALERDLTGKTAVHTAAWTIECPRCAWGGWDGYQRRDMSRRVEERERQLLKEVCDVRARLGGYLLG